MMMPKRVLRVSPSAVLLSALAFASNSFAQSAPPPTTPPPAQPAGQSTAPDESVLGTIEVTGSPDNPLPPLPKLALLPLLTQGNADTVVQLVTRRDLELSGQFDVIDPAGIAGGPFLRDTQIDWTEWQKRGIEYIIKVYANPSPRGVQLVAEAFVAPTKPQGPRPVDAPAPVATPAYTNKLESTSEAVRANSHRLVDALLGGLTGRPGGFSSQMLYAAKVGKWRQIFQLDSDGFNLHPFGPSNATILSPTFGPAGQIVYAISEDFRRFRLALGPDATPIPMQVDGAVLGLSFSPDRTQFAIATMVDGAGSVGISYPIGNFLRAVSTQPLANSPAFGPNNRVAYVAGTGAQRVYIDGKAVSPPGFLASAPSFCDTPQGLLILFTVGVGAGADIISTDTAGGHIRRLTQRMGSNTYATCSPDGRLVAFFSNTKGGKGPGLYIAPIQRPWLAKKIANEVGESLRWEPIH